MGWTYIDALLPQTRKDGVGAPTNGPVLTLKDDTDGAGVTMVHGESEPRQERDDDTALPRGAFTMCPDDTVHNSISDTILNLDLVYDRPARASR